MESALAETAYRLIGGMFTNDLVCRFARYMRGIGNGRGHAQELYCGHVGVVEFRQSRHEVVCGDML